MRFAMWQVGKRWGNPLSSIPSSRAAVFRRSTRFLSGSIRSGLLWRRCRLVAAIIGALFVGVGVGLSVRAGGAPGGDDALSMSLHEVLHQPIERIYLASDLIVLALSATYLPLDRLGCSLLTVILSGQLIGLIQRIPSPKHLQKEAAE